MHSENVITHVACKQAAKNELKCRKILRKKGCYEAALLKFSDLKQLVQS